MATKHTAEVLKKNESVHGPVRRLCRHQGPWAHLQAQFCQWARLRWNQIVQRPFATWGTCLRFSATIYDVCMHVCLFVMCTCTDEQKAVMWRNTKVVARQGKARQGKARWDAPLKWCAWRKFGVCPMTSDPQGTWRYVGRWHLWTHFADFWFSGLYRDWRNLPSLLVLSRYSPLLSSHPPFIGVTER